MREGRGERRKTLKMNDTGRRAGEVKGKWLWRYGENNGEGGGGRDLGPNNAARLFGQLSKMFGRWDVKPSWLDHAICPQRFIASTHLPPIGSASEDGPPGLVGG